MRKIIFLCTAAVLLISGVRAQTVLISNLTETLHNYHSVDDVTWWAEAFITDGNQYNLHSLKLNITAGAANATVKIFSDVSGNIGTELGTFGPATPVSGDIYSFTPSVPLMLDASTNYWIVMQSTSSGTDYWFTNNSSTTTGPGSIPIPPSSLTASTLNGGVLWDYYPKDPDFPPFLFEVMVTPYSPIPFTATASVITNAGCVGQNNGSVTVSVSGGTSPYTYSWSTSPVQTSQTAAGLTAGTYHVTVTDFVGAHAYASAAVTADPLPTPAISGTSVVTEGQTETYITPQVTGHTYSWSASHGNAYPCLPGMNCLTLRWDFPCGIVNPGYVKVTETITSTGCSATSTLWITVNP